VSFPRYPEYKDSGVEWLAPIPSHWSVRRVRFVAELNPSKSEVSSLAPDTEVSFLPMEAIGEDGSHQLDQVRLLSDVLTGYTFFIDGDVAIAKITPCFENGKGAVMRNLRNGIGFGTTELMVARPRAAATTSSFLHWLFSSHAFRQAGEAFMYGAGGQKRIPDDFVRNFATAFPPLPEQHQVAAFLDREAAKIDALVEEQKRLIELLKEKRQAVISQAVTKGLDQNVQMKSTGQVVGVIPVGWAAKRLKYLVRHADGIQMGPFGGMLLQLESEDTGFKVYGQENTISGDFTLGTRWVTEERFNVMRSYQIEVGDLLLTRKGSLGNARLIANIQQPGVIDSDTIRVRVQPNLMQPELLALLLHEADYISDQIALAKRGAILPGLNSETIANIEIALPPHDQQVALLQFLREQRGQFDQLVADAQLSIHLLQERRSALISAAVTGKIDVRGLVPQPEVISA
jgi:type I restriction enzyme S subunit